MQGLTQDSFKNMQLNAGAFFREVDTSFITPETTSQEIGEILKQALADGKCLGATTGGGTFTAVPEIRQIEADGMRSPIIGSTVIDSWEIKLTTTLKEVTEENLKLSLSTAEKDETTGAIRIRNNLKIEDYLGSILWCGDLLDGRLMLVEIKNALNTTGFNFTFTDKGEGTFGVELRGHQANLEDMEYAPANMWLFPSPNGENGGEGLEEIATTDESTTDGGLTE